MSEPELSSCQKARLARLASKVVQISLPKKAKEPPPKPIVGDYLCTTCGDFRVKRGVGYSHPGCTGPQPIDYQIEREGKCGKCVYNFDGVCAVYKLQYPDRPATVEFAIREPVCDCPIGEFTRREIDCPDCKAPLIDLEKIPTSCRYCGWVNQRNQIANVPTFDRVKHPDDCLVITSADQKFIRGAYFLAWTLLKANDIRLRVYLYGGVDESDSHVQQMKSWGVEFRQGVQDVPEETFFSQTWNKPGCVLDAIDDASRVLWSDSDISVNGSISDAFDWIEREPFAPNHGNRGGDNTNHLDVWRFIGLPKRLWDKTNTPCAGVIGLDSERDRTVIELWRHRCLQIVERPDLWLTGNRENERNAKLKYYDQGIFQDIWDWDTADGRRWCNFNAKRKGSIRELMAAVYGGSFGTIVHHAGPIKPWFDWPEKLDWGKPF